MGFYGNITNTTQTNFVFDKIYTNRYSMEQKLAQGQDDGVFIGRYVLIEYGEVDQNNSFIRAYKIGQKFYLTEQENSNTELKYTDMLSQVGNNYVTKGMSIYTVDNNTNTYTYYQCAGPKSKGSITPEFVQVDLNVLQSDPWYYNMQQDVSYGHSRGYDSTVWVKTTVNGEIKYVNIAELNSVIPTFQMVADAPTMSPILPHFDTASTNVYYKLHWQPAWGMRVAEAKAKNGEIYSDYETEWSQEVYNADGTTTVKWYNPSNGLWQENKGENTKIKADIYFNRAAFDAQVGVAKDDIKKKNMNVSDYIGVTADGESGNEYNKHNNTLDTEKKPDTQQIHISLPAIGNMMSDAWDIIHGTDRDDYKGEWKKKDDGSYEINSDGTRKDFSSLKGRLDSISAIATNQIPVKRLDTGELVGTTINGASKYDTEADGLNGQIKNNTDFSDDAWVQTHVDATQTPNAISIHHTYHSTNNTVSSLDKNNGTQILDDSFKNGANAEKLEKIPVLNKEGVETGKEDTIKLYTPYVDATGHVVGKNIETITLPYGFKTITATNSTNTDKWSQLNGATSSKNENVKNIVADNTKDTFNFKGGNKWIRFETDALRGTDTNNTTTSDGNNSLTIAHETHNIVTTPLVSDFNNEEDIKYIKINLTNSEYKKGKYYWYNNTTKKYEIDNNDTLVSGREHFIVNDKIAFQDLKFDTAGHVTDNQTHTYTLPYGYKYFETEGLSNEHEKDLYTKNTDNEAGRSEEKDTEGIVNKTEAHNTQDLLVINPANKWIQTRFVDNDGRRDELIIAHEIHSIDERNSENGDKDASNKGTSHTNPNKETGATNEINLTMYDWSYDKAGHITSKRKHTYTLPFGYKTFTDGTNSSVASSTQDTFKFIGDSWLKPTVANDQITYTHIGPVATTAQNLSNETPKFGDTFKIEDWSFDSKGHKANRSTHTIKIPGLSLTNDTTGGNVVTSIEYKYDTTNHGGSFTETKEDIGTLKLGTHTGTTTTTNGLNILNSDTISGAFDKTQTHINSLIVDNSSTTEFISKITQTDGQVAVERAAAGTLVLGKENADYSVPATASTIVYNDSLATAFGKVEAQIKAETAARQKEIADLINSAPEALDTLGEVAGWINNDTTGAAAMANDIGDLKTKVGSTSVESQINTKINGLNKTDTAKTGQYVSAVSETNGVISVTRANLPTLSSGTQNGTVKLGTGSNVAVTGLKSAAYTDVSEYIRPNVEFVYGKIQQDNGEGGTTEVELKTTIEEMAKEIASLKQVLKDNGLITE